LRLDFWQVDNTNNLVTFRPHGYKNSPHSTNDFIEDQNHNCDIFYEQSLRK
jgi:hypothetical protein